MSKVPWRVRLHLYFLSAEGCSITVFENTFNKKKKRTKNLLNLDCFYLFFKNNYANTKNDH